MSFSTYLVGTWENHRIAGVSTIFQIVNPTLDDLDVIVAFFDSEENPVRLLRSSDSDDPKVGGHKGALTPNDMWEIKIDSLKPDLGEQFGRFGVVKIISCDEERKIAKEGIVGFQRQLLLIPTAAEAAFSEAPLAAVPCRYAQSEYYRIMYDLQFP